MPTFDRLSEIILYVEDLGEAREYLASHDVELGDEIRHPAPDVYVLDGRDPEGNKFSVETVEGFGNDRFSDGGIVVRVRPRREDSTARTSSDGSRWIDADVRGRSVVGRPVGWRRSLDLFVVLLGG